MRPAARYLLFGNRLPGLQLGFATDIYSVDGSRYSSFLSLPGATYTRAGAATAETAAGAIINFAANVPRITDRGVLIEEARTNLLLRSAEFDNAAWSKVEATVTANATAAPDGTTTADALVESSTAAAVHYVLPASGVGTITATETLSVYAKSAGRSWVLLQLGSGRTAYFNVSTGVIGTTGGGTTATITALANGWYRCAISGVRDANLNNIIYLASGDGVISYTGDGTSGVFLWGAQLEAGAFPTSYIPTTGAAATRARDIMSCSAFAGLNYPLTLFAEVDRVVDTGGAEGYVATSFDGSNFGELFTSSGDKATCATTGGGNRGSAASVPVGSVSKIAGRCETNNVNVALNGTAAAADVTATMPSAPTRIELGVEVGTGAGSQPNGYIRRTSVYPRAFSDAELQALTT